MTWENLREISPRLVGRRRTFPCGRVTRRQLLHRCGLGFVGTAMGYLLQRDGRLRSLHASDDSSTPAGPPPSNPSRSGAFAPKLPVHVDSVIFLFMCGGVSHIDTFDPKDNKWAGTMVNDAIGFGDNLAPMRRPVIPCLRTFTRYGGAGIPVSDWFPHVGEVIDDIAIVRSMYCHQSNHFPAAIEMATGHSRRPFDFPCLGSWVSYALGSANENLPVFVNIGRPSSPVQISGGVLGASEAATPFQPNDRPVPNLLPPRAVSAAERAQHLEVLERLNEQFRSRYELDAQIKARIRSYELAARMQLAAPEAVDLASEPPAVRALYGVDAEPTDEFGRQLLLARRLVERGVRFVQICHAGGGNGRWDTHNDVSDQAPLCRQTDRPIAGLIRDLKQRGLLDRTLVVWATEFGRTPWSQNTKGRDHNPRGFTCWLAGGGVKGGVVHGRTDDFGYHAIEDRHYITDLQSTILRQLGLEADQMEVEINGQPIRLVEEGDGPILDIL